MPRTEKTLMSTGMMSFGSGHQRIDGHHVERRGAVEHDVAVGRDDRLERGLQQGFEAHATRNPAPGVRKVEVCRHQLQIGGRRPDSQDGRSDGNVLDQHVVERPLLGVGVEAQRLGHVPLRVAVHGEDRGVPRQDRGQRHR